MVKIQWNIITRKKYFYIHSNMEDVADADYSHAKGVCNDFEIKKLGEYHDLFVKHDSLLF